jgi:outer membrane receptor protein involved in Fe transport
MAGRARGIFILAILMSLATVSLAAGQVITATIRGKVVDQQGGVLPGATITARQLETNTVKTGVTTALGTYYLPSLPAGTYEVEVTLSGFAPLKRSVELAVGADVTLEFTLKVGTVETQITVTGESPLIETTRTVVGETISKAQIDNLPTVNRDFTSLALLAPGVTAGVGGNGPTLAVNAQRGYQNGIFVDGASNIWQYYGRQASTFSQDWIQEFQVMTNSFSAEFGTASGGILNVITRSGANEFNGRAYGYFRRKAFDSPPFAGYFNNDNINDPVFLTKDEVPNYTQRRWGGYFGGPIMKNKLFFFAGYEDLNRGSTDTLAITQYWKDQGYNPVVPTKTTDHPFMVKGDYNISTSNRLSLRGDRTINKAINEGGVYNPTEGRDTFGGPVWNIVANLTSTLSNSSFNEFRAYYMSNMPPIICNASGVGGMASLQKGPPGTYAQIRYPNLYIGCPIFTGTEGEQNLVFLDHYSVIRGRHQFKVGGQVQRNTLNDDISNFHDGYWRLAQDLLFDKNDPATYPYRFVGNVGPGAFKLPIWNFNLFAQDTWQVGDNLTLNLGVRYDVDRSVTAGNQYVDAKNADVIAKSGGSAPLQKTNVDYNNVAPRLGFVWTPTPDKRTTVRGAVGLFYDQNHGNFNAIYIINTLLSDGLIVLNCNLPGYNPFWNSANQAAGITACRGWMAQSFPYFPDLSKAPAATQGLDTLDPNLQVPYTLQFSGGVAHEFTNGFVLSADFVHSRGSGLEYMDIGNRLLPDGSVESLDPRFNYISQLEDVGFTHYSALQTKAQYRQKVFNLAISYTLSKANSNLVSGSVFGSNPTNPFDLSQDLGPDDTDLRHNLVLNGSYMFPYDIQLAGIFVYRSAWPWSAYTAENPTGAYYPPRIEPKNSRRGAMEKNVDFRVGKMFRLGSKVQASLFWEMFNAFNWTNYNGMNTLIDDTATFGLYNSAADMRRQQLGFRIDF